jgi:hypothetical protein
MEENETEGSEIEMEADGEEQQERLDEFGFPILEADEVEAKDSENAE